MSPSRSHGPPTKRKGQDCTLGAVADPRHKSRFCFRGQNSAKCTMQSRLKPSPSPCGAAWPVLKTAVGRKTPARVFRMRPWRHSPSCISPVFVPETKKCTYIPPATGSSRRLHARIGAGSTSIPGSRQRVWGICALPFANPRGSGPDDAVSCSRANNQTAQDVKTARAERG